MARVASSVDLVQHVLLAPFVIVVSVRFCAVVWRRIGQPEAIGELSAGPVLGPSLLSSFAPHVQRVLIPPEVVLVLGVHAQVGVIPFMFLVGLDLDLHALRRGDRRTVAIAYTSIVPPFALAVGMGAGPLSRDVARRAAPAVFAAFFGVALPVTPFPMLARILGDRGMHRTDTGAVALACAAIDRATAWCLLAARGHGAQAASRGDPDRRGRGRPLSQSHLQAKPQER